MLTPDLIGRHADLDFCYLTTTGRRTGRPHTIEIWFGADDRALFVMSGSGRSDWVLNLLADPSVVLRLGDHTAPATARVVSDPAEDGRARRLLAAKYQEWSEGEPLSEWAATALVVAIEDARPAAESSP